MKCATSELFQYAAHSIFEGRLSSAAACPVVRRLFPLSFSLDIDTCFMDRTRVFVQCSARGKHGLHEGPLSRGISGRRTVWSEVMHIVELL